MKPKDYYISSAFPLKVNVTDLLELLEARIENAETYQNFMNCQTFSA